MGADRVVTRVLVRQAVISTKQVFTSSETVLSYPLFYSTAFCNIFSISKNYSLLLRLGGRNRVLFLTVLLTLGVSLGPLTQFLCIFSRIYKVGITSHGFELLHVL